MSRSPLTLAALATAAIPALAPVDARAVAGPVGTDSAQIVDDAGRVWLITAPQNSAAGAGLDAEAALLERLQAKVGDKALPFTVLEPAGWAPLPEGGRACLYQAPRGRVLNYGQLQPRGNLARALGEAIGKIHELSPKIADDLGLPNYDSEDYRTRCLVELDEAARTGHVPAGLLRRWERALENVALWKFSTVFTHGDLAAEQVLIHEGKVSTVLGWNQACVADPASDLAWLITALPEDVTDTIIESYALTRSEEPDKHLQTRAILAGEFAVARWLLHGARTEDQEVIDDAVQMLRELDSDLEGAQLEVN